MRVIAIVYGVVYTLAIGAFAAGAVWLQWQRHRERRDARMQKGEKPPEWFMESLMIQLAEEGVGMELEPEPVLVRVKAERYGSR